MPDFSATASNGLLPGTAQKSYRSWLKNDFLTPWEGSESHFFIVHTGVFDYQPPVDGKLLPAPEYMGVMAATKFNPRMETVVFWSPDQGFRFLQPSMRDTFLTTLGLQAGPAPSEAERAAARIMGQELPDPGDIRLPTGMRESLEMGIEFLKKAERGSAMFLVENLDLMFPNGRGPALMSESQTATLAMLKRMALDPDLDACGNPFIAFADSLMGILPELRTAPGVRDIEIGLPFEDERVEYIEAYLKGNPYVELDMTPRQLAALTAGLFRRSIEEMFLEATTVARKAGAERALVTLDLVRRKKKVLMKVEYGDVLQQLDPVGGLEMVGGLVEAKGFFEDWIIQPFLTGTGRKSVPRVLVLSGPPGTGKTHIAGCVGFDAKVNVIIVRPDLLLGSLVGESEKLLAKLFAGVRAFAPCIMIIDEADQKLRRVTGGSGSGGDSVSANQFGSWLEFLSDPNNAGQVCTILLTNRPDQLDDALKSRAAYRIPILPVKGDEGRADILSRILRSRGMVVSSDLLVPIASKMRDEDGWSGREMEQTVDKAKGLADIKGLDIVSALERAAAGRKAMKSTESDMMTKLAIDECNDMELIPAGYLTELAETNSDKLLEDIANLRNRQRQVRGATRLED